MLVKWNPKRDCRKVAYELALRKEKEKKKKDCLCTLVIAKDQKKHALWANKQVGVGS